MRHTLTLELPDEIYQPLVRNAERSGRTPEALASEWLVATVQRIEQDPLLRWVGAIESDVTDVSERHDHYLGQGLLKELRGNQDA